MFTYINKAVMELEAHDRGKAPGLSNQSLLHDIPDHEFGSRARFRVMAWPELRGGHSYVKEDEWKQRRH